MLMAVDTIFSAMTLHDEKQKASTRGNPNSLISYLPSVFRGLVIQDRRWDDKGIK